MFPLDTRRGKRFGCSLSNRAGRPWLPRSSAPTFTPASTEVAQDTKASFPPSPPPRLKATAACFHSARQGLWSLAHSLEGAWCSFPDKTEGWGITPVEGLWFILHPTKCTGRFDRTGMERPLGERFLFCFLMLLLLFVFKGTHCRTCPAWLPSH